MHKSATMLPMRLFDINVWKCWQPWICSSDIDHPPLRISINQWLRHLYEETLALKRSIGNRSVCVCAVYVPSPKQNGCITVMYT